MRLSNCGSRRRYLFVLQSITSFRPFRRFHASWQQAGETCGPGRFGVWASVSGACSWRRRETAEDLPFGTLLLPREVGSYSRGRQKLSAPRHRLCTLGSKGSRVLANKGCVYRVHRSPNVIAFSSEIVGSHSMFPVGGNVNQFNHNRKWYGGSSNFFLNKTTRQSSNPTSGCISKGKEVIMLKRYLNTC